MLAGFSLKMRRPFMRAMRTYDAMRDEKDLSQSIARLNQRQRLLKKKRKRIQNRLVAALIVQFDLSMQQIRDLVKEASLHKVNKKQITRAFFEFDSAMKLPAMAKYRHPQTGEQWAGRGRTPLWIREAEQKGIDREVFRTPESLQLEQSRRAKAQNRIIRYRNPQTGQTWTGLGRPPSWLVQAEKSGINRETFLIDPPQRVSSAE